MSLEFEIVLEMIFSVVGGLGIFLFGMRNMSEGLQTIAGDRLRKLIGAVTDNRLLATGVGTLVTSIVQSSSVTTVMVVGFVNSGLMALHQAIGVIMGANIGTTITGWILVLDIGKYGLPILGICALVSLFAKNERLRYGAMALMGVGMIFFGLELMKNGFKPIRDLPEFLAWFRAFSADSYSGVLKCAAAGCVLTLIVQSSSATLGITMGLAATGVIGFETAAALVLGENIGTTITAILASLGTSTNARRAAYAHTIFNIIGVAWITLIFPFYILAVKKFLGCDPDMTVITSGIPEYPHIQAGIAAVHTGFNVINTLLFLPLVPFLEKLLKRIVPEKPYKEPPHLTSLDKRMLAAAPVVSIEQSRREILLMGESIGKMLDCLRDVLDKNEGDVPQIKMLFRREEILDTIQKEVVEFLTNLLSLEVPRAIAEEAYAQMRRADEYESISDNLVGVLKLHLRLHHAGLKLDDEESRDILALHDTVKEYFELIYKAHLDRNREIMSWAYPQSDAITHLFREMRGRHLARLCQKVTDPLLCTSCMDILSTYRRIKDHLLNVAEALAGEK